MEWFKAAIVVLLPASLYAGSLDVRQDTVDGQGVRTMNDNFRRLDREKMSKADVQKMITDTAVPDDLSVITVDASTVTASAFVGGTFYGSIPVMFVIDVKSDGTTGGGATGGSWTRRTLNTISTNTISGASLSGNQITLPAGRYVIYWSAPAYKVNRHVTTLHATSGTSLNIRGGHAWTSNADAGSTTYSSGFAIYAPTAESTIELLHICTASNSVSGWGDDDGIAGTEEFYSEVMIWKM